MNRTTLHFVLLVSVVTTAHAQPDNWKQVRQKTESQLAAIAGRTKGTVGICALDPSSGERFGINEKLVFPQGSAIKIPILMEVYKQATEGKFRLTDLRWIEKSTQVGGSGILQEFGDKTSQLSIRDLCTLMIVLSDNTATNMLIDLVGMENVNATMASLGLRDTRLRRKMLDTDASARGEENVSTPAEACRILELLLNDQFIRKEICGEILSILKIPKPNAGGISSGVPDGTPVAFKPGDIPGASTEWAIVFMKDRPYVVSVMENYALDVELAAVKRDVSRVLYDYFWRLAISTKHGVYADPELFK